MKRLCSFISHLVVVLVCLCSSPLWGKTEWLHARTDNFEVFSSLDRSSTRDTIMQLEDVMRCFGDVLGSKSRYPVRTLVILCEGEREMKEFRDPRDKNTTSQTSAMVVMGADIPGLVIRDRLEYTRGRSLVYSAMAGVMVDSQGSDTPFWFQTGFSEVFATLSADKKCFVVGKASTDILSMLRRARGLSLKEMMEVTVNSRVYRDEESRSIYNAYCWAFVHMCLFGRETDLRTPLLAFLEAEPKERDKVALMERVFGMSLGDLEDKVSKYITRGRYRTIDAVRDSGKVPQVEFSPVVPAELAAAKLGLQARLIDGRERLDAALAAYRFLADGNNEYLCSMASRHCRLMGESELADTLGERAIALGSRNPFVYIDQLSAQVSTMPMTVTYRMPEDVAAKLRGQVDRALALYPDHRGLINALAYVEAFAPVVRPAELKRIEEVANTASERRNLLSLLTYIYWRHDDADSAKRIIEQLREEGGGRLPSLAQEVEFYLKQGKPWRPVL